MNSYFEGVNNNCCSCFFLILNNSSTNKTFEGNPILNPNVPQNGMGYFFAVGLTLIFDKIFKIGSFLK